MTKKEGDLCACLYIYIKEGPLAHCLGENLSSRSLDEVVSFFQKKIYKIISFRTRESK